MTNPSHHTDKAERVSHLRWVPIAEMEVSPKAQQEFRPSHAERFASDFDIEALGYPVVSHRGAHYFIVDGQHRVAALKLIGYGDQQIQCECYEGLTEEQEAELFLRRNTRREPPAFEKFRIAITAGREIECDIERTVRANGLTISKTADGISAVATLRKIYTRSGPAVMGRSLRLLRDAYGSSGLEGPLIDGISLLCQRYDGDLPAEGDVAVKLANTPGGMNGLLTRANLLRKQTGSPKTHCIAAAAVECVNAGSRKKLPNWWKP